MKPVLAYNDEHMTYFQSISDFFQCFSQQSNSEKNKLGYTKAQPQRGDIASQ